MSECDFPASWYLVFIYVMHVYWTLVVFCCVLYIALCRSIMLSYVCTAFIYVTYVIPSAGVCHVSNFCRSNDSFRLNSGIEPGSDV